MKSFSVVELLGDGIGAELSTAVHRLAEKALPFKIEFRQPLRFPLGRSRAFQIGPAQNVFLDFASLAGLLECRPLDGFIQR